MATKSGLGKGFESLIPQNFDGSLLLDESERVQRIELSKLVPNSGQPRQEFDEVSLRELADSIKNHGVLLPVVVTKAGDDQYRIVAGERRFRAAKLAKLKTIPAIVRSLKELEELEIALVENVQRVDLSPLEQAVSIQKLHDQFSIGYDDIAKRLGKAYSTVHNIMRLLNLPDAAKQALIAGEISEGHARANLAIQDPPAQQAALLGAITQHGWSVRQAERFVASIKAGIKEKKAAHARVNTETPETKSLGKRLKTKVTIRRTAKGGKLEIGFTSDDELSRIIDLLQK
jgi:ParB family chromosome partitioning protein